jgi:hypothetical protein
MHRIPAADLQAFSQAQLTDRTRLLGLRRSRSGDGESSLRGRRSGDLVPTAVRVGARVPILPRRELIPPRLCGGGGWTRAFRRVMRLRRANRARSG